jgi:hypothetical protein
MSLSVRMQAEACQGKGHVVCDGAAQSLPPHILPAFLGRPEGSGHGLLAAGPLYTGPTSANDAEQVLSAKIPSSGLP